MSLIELRSDPPGSTAAVRGRAAAVAAQGREPVGGDAPWWRLAAIALLAAAGMVAVAGQVVVNGDGVWHLIWGRALAHGTLDTFATGPTPHPLLLVLGVATSALGDEASYAVTYVLLGPLAAGVLIAAVVEVSRRLSSTWAAAVAVLILATSYPVLSFTAYARYDIAFAALVMAAVALEMARPRRGAAPLACLAVAGTIRPEAWILAGAYWCWLAPRWTWSTRLRMGALVAIAPALWMSMDVLVMGDPLYSLHVTDTGSANLYGKYTPWENLEAAGRNVLTYIGALPLLAVAVAVALLARDRPRVAQAPLGVLAVTLGVFVLLVSLGMASNERYLLVPVCILAALAGVAADGGGRRTPRRVFLGVVLAVFISVQIAARTDSFGVVGGEAATGAAWYANAKSLVDRPGVREALRSCPAVSLAGGAMFHWFAFYSGRPADTFAADDAGRTRPELFIAPASPAISRLVLTRARFDGDASFRVPPGLRPGPRNRDWALYVSPTAACTRALR